MTQLVNIGDVLAGKYRVEKILGIGGMGMVVAARHLELDQRVALRRAPRSGCATSTCAACSTSAASS